MCVFLCMYAATACGAESLAPQPVTTGSASTGAAGMVCWDSLMHRGPPAPVCTKPGQHEVYYPKLVTMLKYSLRDNPTLTDHYSQERWWKGYPRFVVQDGMFSQLHAAAVKFLQQWALKLTCDPKHITRYHEDVDDVVRQAVDVVSVTGCTPHPQKGIYIMINKHL